MQIAALQTARAKSSVVKNKNVKKVNGIPTFLHNIIHVNNSKYNLPIYLSTDIEIAHDYKHDYNYKIIKRPKHLGHNDSSHHDTIIHGLKNIEKLENNILDYLLVILGNNISAWPQDIDKAIEIISANKKIDSVITVGKYNMFTPIRSLNINQNGYLKPMIDKNIVDKKLTSNDIRIKNTNDKDILGDIYYFNGSLMLLRRDAVMNTSEEFPFPWLGNNVFPIIQNSACMEIDADWQLGIINEISFNIENYII